MKSVRKVAIVSIAMVMIMVIVAGIFVTIDTIDQQPEASFQVDYTPVEETTQSAETVEAPRPKSICLIDQSGSMDEYSGKLFFAAGYDIIRTFGEDDSKITTEVVNYLDNGYQRIGVVTDLESWPYEEIESISGRSFSNCEIIFYIPENVDQDCYLDYVTRYRNALDADNCTFRFVYLESQKVVSVFENYRVLVTVPVSQTEATTGEPIKVSGSYVEGNKIPYSLVLLLIVIFFLIIMSLIIAIIAIAGVFGKDKKKNDGKWTGVVPAGIKRSIHTDAVALDSSASVSNLYSQYISWCKSEGVSTVYRFANNVEELSISEAENKSAGGQTKGYECLRELYDKGYKEITIVSDMEFNDDIVDQVMFDKIFFVGSNITESDIKHLKAFCKTYEVISI